MLSLNLPIEQLPGVGSTTASKLSRLGLTTLNQLIHHYPFRYDDFSQQLKINQLTIGQVVNVTGTIDIISTKRSPRRRMYLTEAILNDGSGQIRLVWFNQPFLTRNIKEGDQLSIAGKVSQDLLGLVISSPQYEKTDSRTQHTRGLVPVYRTVSDLSTKQLRSIIDTALELVQVKDWLPEEIIKSLGLWSLDQALPQLHRPDSLANLEKAQQRIAFDELLLLQLQSQLTRQAWLTRQAPIIKFNQKLTKQVLADWPFKLTNDQRRSAWQIIQDLEKPQPMLRLLQGDVGSGKTAVAILAMVNVVNSGWQAALLAPSEVLAYQHFQSLVQLIGQHCSVGLLTRSQQLISQPQQEPVALTKARLIKQLANSDCQVIVGTQALLQEAVNFHQLALLVVDEQQRFGVEQRQLLLNEKLFQGNQSLVPHFLSMTATPIPRSLALALYGELSLSLIKELPVGRLPVITKIITNDQREAMYQQVRELLDQGQQAFVVCPLVEESDKLMVKSVTAEYERLVSGPFANYSVGLLHGRLPGSKKQTIMNQFVSGQLQVLVATAVIELGVDVPGATVMIVESAERFGLAQLHQYRGRVGRRQQQAYCFLLSNHDGSMVQQRLQALVEHHSGQELAKLDLGWRGPGQLLGYQQSGFSELKLASIFDYQLIIAAKEAATKILNNPQWRSVVLNSFAGQKMETNFLPE